MLQHTGSIKFLLKHKLVPWNNPTQTLWESQQNKLVILHPKHGILAGETPVILRFEVQTAPALPGLRSPGNGMYQPSWTCPGHWDHARVGFQNEFGISHPFPTIGSLELSNLLKQLQGGTGKSCWNYLKFSKGRGFTTFPALQCSQPRC